MMKFNVGITGKGYCFVEVPNLTLEEYMKGENSKIIKAIYEKYGNCVIQGFCPAEENVEVLPREGK